MQHILKLVTEAKLANEKVKKYTLIIDEQQREHGALFFIEVKGKSYKVLLPSPYHQELLKDSDPTFQQVLSHREAMLLK